jgi:hypothetical protein
MKQQVQHKKNLTQRSRYTLVVSLSTFFVVNTPSRFHDLICSFGGSSFLSNLCDSMDAPIIDELMVGLNLKWGVDKI